MRLAPRCALLTTALAALRVGTREPELELLHAWLDTWTGIGHLTVGMARQGYDLQLTRYAERGWRATFFVSGAEHSLTGDTGSTWESMPWRAVQGAAWEVVK